MKHFRSMLVKMATTPAFAPRVDEGLNAAESQIVTSDGLDRLNHALEALLTHIVEAAIADGMGHDDIMRMFVTHAFEVMGCKLGDHRPLEAGQVLAEVLEQRRRYVRSDS